MTDTTLTHIQETLAHQEQQINDLSDIVVQQGEMIKTLQAHVLKLKDKVEHSTDEKPTADQKPPHY